MAREIFISYRRGDSSGFTGRLYDRLSDRFGAGVVFMDVDGIDPGLDFVDVLNEQLANCKALVAVIGKDWLSALDAKGRRRLDDPNDFVRLEIAHALSRGIRVIPVLVEGADPPGAEDLPEALASFSRRQGVTLSHERFGQDVQSLIGALEKVVSAPEKPAEKSQPSGDRSAAILETLRKFAPYSQLTVAPNIPRHKEMNARSKIKAEEDQAMLGLIDMTAFGNANDCLAFMADKIYGHNMGDHALVEYADLKRAPISVHGFSDVMVGPHKIGAAGCGSRETLVKVLQALGEAL